MRGTQRGSLLGVGVLVLDLAEVVETPGAAALAEKFHGQRVLGQLRSLWRNTKGRFYTVTQKDFRKDSCLSQSSAKWIVENVPNFDSARLSRKFMDLILYLISLVQRKLKVENVPDLKQSDFLQHKGYEEQRQAKSKKFQIICWTSFENISVKQMNCPKCSKN